MSNKIIGISGISGAGKTTLAAYLSKLLKATMVSWDDFDAISTGPEDYVEWYERGKHYEAWDCPHLARVLTDLKYGKSIQHPALNRILEPTPYIIFDAPLGRLHEQTGCHIDCSAHINVPLDVALARRTIRDFSPSDKTKEQLVTELQCYLSDTRKLFLDDDLNNSADLVVDGMLTIAEQAKRIAANLGA